MADSFFGFNTTLSAMDEGSCLSDDEYDLLNEETFGLEASQCDWEDQHETYAKFAESNKKSKDDDLDLEASLSNLVLDDCIVPAPSDLDDSSVDLDPKVWASPEKPITQNQVPRTLCTVEEIERSLLRPPLNQNLSHQNGIMNNPPHAQALVRHFHPLQAKMGYQTGTGLGLNAQGIVEPIEASKQRGRRGLGLQIANLGPDDAYEFNADDEIVKVEEEIEWLKSKPFTLDYEQIKGWIVEGPRKKVIDDETNFIDEVILKKILHSKSIFDNIKPEQLRRARTRSNPYETIRSAFFLNRAAVKMANMDARNDFMFTDPIKRDGSPAVKENELLYFADVCAGPGGFSEYVLWRKKWFAKGFGFTLKGSNDFKLGDFLAGSPETFEAYYGEDGDGDVFKPRNIDSLRLHVLEHTEREGVHFMMADGGFSVEGQENIQEILSKQLYLCQCLVALSIVREEGHFVVKLFDLVTKFSMGLMYLMYYAFEEICIMKPNTSRPANSERYLLCKWRRKDVESIRRYLYDINLKLFNYPINHKQDINEIVPLDVLQEDREFMSYFIDSNNKIGEQQIVGLTKICAFHKNSSLTEARQIEMRNKCLQAWKLEKDIRRNLSTSAKDVLEELTKDLNRPIQDILSLRAKSIETIQDVKNFVGEIPAHRFFMFLGKVRNGEEDPPTFFLGAGGNKIFRYANGGWSLYPNLNNIRLPYGTLVYGEVALEYRGEYKVQTNVPVLHIIDALYLGRLSLFEFDLVKRAKLCELFTKSISMSNHKSVRMKDLLHLEDFSDQQTGLDIRYMKGGHRAMAYPLFLDKNEPLFYVPRGIIFFNAVGNGWGIAWSSTHKKIYYHKRPNHSMFERPPNLYGDFYSCFDTRSIWMFESSVQCLDDETADQHPESLHAHDIIKFYDSTHFSNS